MDRYDKGKIIGSGTFGSVYLVKSRLTRQTFVLKEINIFAASESDKQQARNEVDVLMQLKHRHIISCKDTFLNREKKTMSIVMEYAESGDLHAAIVRQNGVPFSEHRIMTWFVQISLALQYIHHKNIIHRDLKSQNVFLTRNKVVKIGDFGISRILRNSEDLAKTAIGTPYYLSPEIVNRQYYNFKTDIWSMGCVLFEMAALEQAFKANDITHLLTLIKNGTPRELPRHCSPLIKDMVSRLLQNDPIERPSAGEILSDPALQPYLSEYMIGENTKENYLASTKEKSSAKKGAVGNIILKELRDGTKRRASLSNMNQKEAKRTVTSGEHGSVRPRNQPTTLSFAARHQTKPAVKSRIENPRKMRQVAFKPPASSQDVATQSSFTVSCDTYEMPTNAVSKLNLTRSENANLDQDQDSGYQTTGNKNLDPNFGTFNCKNLLPNDGFATFNYKKLFSLSSFKKCANENKASSTGEFSEACAGPSTGTIPKIQITSAHDHCQHSQCHQCLLDMMWRNRIRCTSVDTNEYKELKEKLRKVFQKDLFKKVYQALVYDWDRTDVTTSNGTFQGVFNTLTYEQGQHLPLMMQLIQLDVLMKSRV